MRDLERELQLLQVEWPQTPDLAAAVLPRLEAAPARSPRRRRWGRVVAALVALLLGAVAAVEPARSAVLEFLGLRSVEVQRREPTATPVPPGAELGLGRAVTQAQADALAGFGSRPPAELGAPEAIYFEKDPPRDGAVHYVYGGVLVSEYAPSTTPFVEKSIGARARLERLRVDGDPAYFISGAPHGVAYQDATGVVHMEEQRLAGNTLLVERDDLLIRVEGDLPRDRAITIARSIPRT